MKVTKEVTRKTISISACIHCPHCREYEEGDFCCYTVHRRYAPTEKNIIPDGCPLPDGDPQEKRADDVDRLVEAAKEIDVCSFEEDGTVSRAYWKLHKARAPFMEKERGNVPVVSEEGFSNEEKP